MISSRFIRRICVAALLSLPPCAVLAVIVDSSADLPTLADTIGNVLERGDAVITFTKDSFYVGSSTAKTWKKMETPQWMLPLQGELVQQGPDSQELVFVRRYQGKGDVPADFATVTVSGDLGKTWDVTTKGRKWFSPFFINAKGVFFTVERNDPGWRNVSKTPPAPANNPDRLLRSEDMGKTWKDITNNLPGSGRIEEIFQDPDHPGLVYVTFMSGSGVELRKDIQIFQADDESYNWQEKNDPKHFFPARAAAPPDPTAPHGSGVVGEAYGMDVSPTLSNYFLLPFKESGRNPIAAYQLGMEKREYTFTVKEPKIVTAKLLYLREGTSIRTTDLPDETVFWGAIVVAAPTGARAEQQPRSVTDLSDEEDMLPIVNPTQEQQKKIDTYLHDPHLATPKLDPKHPYERKIDLSKFYDFSTPGKYRVRLLHNEMWVLRKGAELAGPVIDVTITP